MTGSLVHAATRAGNPHGPEVPAGGVLPVLVAERTGDDAAGSHTAAP